MKDLHHILLTDVFTSECRTAYHHNYSVKGGTRKYHFLDKNDPLPKYLHVGEHQYVEASLARHWVNSMVASAYVDTHDSRLDDSTLTLVGQHLCL